MDSVLAIALIAGIGFVMFRSGKQLGSRLGFGAGRRTQRRRYR
jgi:hypothetical protein